MSSATNNAHRRQERIIFSCLCPVLAMIGLFRFSTAFFLSKRSMPHSSPCHGDSAGRLLKDLLGLTDEEIQKLYLEGLLSAHGSTQNISLKDAAGPISESGYSEGCWMDRRIDAMVVIVVDALRFDFARDHLPKSVGARLGDSSTPSSSQLFKFIADPPTVTMQRLKGLTTGGLPTFADISGSFGGANIDEDSWVQQLRDVPPIRRGYNVREFGINHHPKVGFVGDDTWVDLFPSQFDDSHPFPSFNTRDLDTVDDGCLSHLPRLLGNFDKMITSDDFFEVVIAHFLGVDHVGHTYGPHGKHMEDKLHQMDDVLSYVLDQIDHGVNSCRVAFIFGDHGMTEDGNHGGGTDDETNAALFAHFSPGCGNISLSSDITGAEAGKISEDSFRSINQIDLVPTISILLGLPIPFANLGGLVPALIPPSIKAGNDAAQAPVTATALALNAAQVWNYLTTYSNTANALPAEPLSDLEGLLNDATSAYKEALSHPEVGDMIAYRKACGLFKQFLSEATDLGKQVWTR